MKSAGFFSPKEERIRQKVNLDNILFTPADFKKLQETKNNGNLKAEHGTGRNMALFVEKEWDRKFMH
jgi:hypothetical protein